MDEPTRGFASELDSQEYRDGGSPGRGVAYGVAFGVVAWVLFAFIVFA